MSRDPADTTEIHLTTVEQLVVLDRAFAASATRGSGNPWRSFRFALEDALAVRLSDARIRDELERLGVAIREDPLYGAQLGSGFDRGATDGMVAALHTFGTSMVDTGRVLLAIQNPVTTALYALDLYPHVKAAADYLQRNGPLMFAAAVDWPRTLATLLVSVGADWLDGFFALTGQAFEQGQHLGRLLGRAMTELYLFVLGLVPGIEELVLGRAAQSIRALAAVVEDLARGASAAGVETVAVVPSAMAAISQAGGQGAVALEEAGQLATRLSQLYREAVELPYLAHGELTELLASGSNRLARDLEELVRGAGNPQLRAAWPSDWQEWLLESHHGIEARIFRDPALPDDVRGFFTFLEWTTTDDMWAVPLSRLTHTRKPATAFRLLDDAVPFSPVTINPNTGVAHLLEDYTTLSQELIRDIGGAGRYRTVEELLDSYELAYRQHGLVNAQGELLQGGLWQRMEPMFRELRVRLANYRQLVPRPTP